MKRLLNIPALTYGFILKQGDIFEQVKPQAKSQQTKEQ
jgi:hypothetical protein